MRKMLKVAQREYVETIKTRTFLLSLLMVPVIIVAIVLIGSIVGDGGKGTRPAIRVGLTCPAPLLRAKVEAGFAAYNSSHPQSPLTLDVFEGDPEERGKSALRQRRIDAYAVLQGDLAAETGTVHLYTYKPKPTQVDAFWTIEGVLRKAVVDYRCEARGLDQQLLAAIRNVPIGQVELGAEAGQERVQSEKDRVAHMMVPFAFMYLIFIGIAGTGQHLLSSIIEEKNSRIIEVLLSAVSPLELMTGKIAGLAGIGITVTILWGAAAYTTATWKGIEIVLGGRLVFFFVLYYLLGFFLFSAILAGVGSICNTVKETQSLMMPVMLVFIIPLLSWMKLARDPNGTLARVLSFVPPTTPMVMILRLSTGAAISAGEVAASILVLAVGVVGAVWLAAKIFRTGILMYGKRPALREVVRWLSAR